MKDGMATSFMPILRQYFNIFCLVSDTNVTVSLVQTYVRDIYPFRRSVSPQLNLVHMLPEKGQELIQKQVWNILDMTVKTL